MRMIQRSLLHLKDVLRRALDDLGDRVTVRVSRLQGPQDHHVQRPFQHLLV